jgi:two-component system sensor histidine kinase HydH
MADPSLLPMLREYVGFDDAAARRLQALAPRMRRFYQRVVDDFYEAILADPAASAVLKNEAQVSRLKLSLRDWIEGLFSGQYDEQYFEKRARIGRVHVKVGLEQRYMLGAMNVIRAGLHRGLAEVSTDGLGATLDHSAIDQICDLELAIMLETYREDYVLKKTAEAESLAVMGRLTAGLAHEVRNPLNAAKLQLDVLRRNAADVQDGSTRRKIQRRTNLVQDELRRLSLLLDDFLNLARARRLEPVHCDACSLLTEVIELRRPEIESQGIELIDEIQLTPCDLEAERDRLKQVVNNLITNAVEAVSECGQPCVRLTSRMANGRWEVSVVDNGPGIAPEVAERAFESFVTTKDAGTGLGLAIVKRIVDLHGGRATLVPEPGGGTRASFWIPAPAV